MLHSIFQSYHRQRLFPDSTYKSLQRLRANDDIKIVPADKNLGLCVLELTHYDRLVRQHLTLDSNYVISGLSEDLVFKQVKSNLNDLFYTLRQLNAPIPKDMWKLLLHSYKCNTWPKFHIMPKLHKAGSIANDTLKSRPIMGTPNWFTTCPARVVSILLQQIPQPFVLRSSQHLIDIIENFSIEDNDVLFVADVDSLYPSICLSTLYEEINLQTNSSSWLILLIKFICSNNYFKYGNDIWLQTDGIAMGSNCSVELANTYLFKLDSRLNKVCKFYRRYVDDVFGIIRKTNIPALKRLANSTLPGIKLSFEFQDFDNRVTFMDLDISVDSSNKLQTGTYSKAINTYQYIPPFSHHPRHCFKGFLRGESIRFIRQCSTQDKYLSQILKFYHNLKIRGYPLSLLLPLICNISFERRARFRTSKTNDTQPIIALLLPFSKNPTMLKLKKLIQLLNNSETAIANKFKFLLVYQKTPSVTQLTIRSNISDSQEILLKNST
jgi:hypothetical protein